MAFCTECGTNVPDDVKFCTACGKPMGAAPQTQPVMAGTSPQAAHPPRAATAVTAPPQAWPAPPSAPVTPQGVGQEAPPPKGSKYEPITTGGYIGIMLLMCIPIVGQILMIVWACGGCRKVGKKSLARASLIMLVVGLVLSLVIGIAAKSLINSTLKEAGIDTEQLGGLAGLVDGDKPAGGSGNSDLDQLGELGALLEGLQVLTGEETGGKDIGDLVGAVEDINRDAEAANDGWPKTLRAYPGGTATAVASYRTEISDTTLDEMLGWIAELKKDGFQYQDFYEMGMSEEDMLDMNGWWAYDGKTYLSVSYADGVVTVDHTKELPDLESYFK